MKYNVSVDHYFRDEANEHPSRNTYEITDGEITKILESLNRNTDPKAIKSPWFYHSDESSFMMETDNPDAIYNAVEKMSSEIHDFRFCYKTESFTMFNP